MAEAVDAKIEIEGVETGTLMVISGNMGSGDARLLARLPIRNGKAAARMPLQAGTSGVTLRVIDATNSVRGDFPVAVSQLTETNTVLRVVSAPSDDYLPTAVRDIEKQTFTIEDFTMEQYEQYLEKYPGGSYPDFETWAKKESLSNIRLNINPETHTIPNLKYIDNLYYEMGPALSFKNELAPAFLYYYNPETGEKTDGVFKEGENNLQKYYHDA
ncbi:MAG: hypothetical protein K2K05_10310, partial [Muribaculaceae bacterium]|nr:hypothetical protein [Muribaculaceae bacterium]